MKRVLFGMLNNLEILNFAIGCLSIVSSIFNLILMSIDDVLVTRGAIEKSKYAA